MVGEEPRLPGPPPWRDPTRTAAAEQRAGATCQGESSATGARRRAAAWPSQNAAAAARAALVGGRSLLLAVAFKTRPHLHGVKTVPAEPASRWVGDGGPAGLQIGEVGGGGQPE